MKKVQYIISPNNGISYYRLVQPIGYLQSLEIEWTKNYSFELLWLIMDEVASDARINCDILMYNKYITTPLDKLKQLQSKGMKIIVDVDDLWVLATNHPNYESWKKAGHSNSIADHIRNANMVTCTSARLRDRIMELNKNVVIIPNALPFGDTGYNRDMWIQSSKSRFVYAGGVTHLPDVKLLEGKFRKINSEPFIKNNAEFILAGYEKAKAKQFFTNIDLEEQNNNYILKDVNGPYDEMKTVFMHTGSYKIIPTSPVDEYLNNYNQADVSLIPLVDNEWNSMKSNLKILEACTRKLPIICSAVSPYIDGGVVGPVMWVHKPDDWLTHIKWCIKNKQDAQDIGEQLADIIWQQYNLKTVNKQRVALIDSL